jgi:hypothetical protein
MLTLHRSDYGDDNGFDEAIETAAAHTITGLTNAGQRQGHAQNW